MLERAQNPGVTENSSVWHQYNLKRGIYYGGNKKTSAQKTEPVTGMNHSFTAVSRGVGEGEATTPAVLPSVEETARGDYAREKT